MRPILLMMIGVLFAAPFFAQAEMTPEQRAELEKQLSQVQAEIQQNQDQMAQQQKLRTSLERDVAILDSKIEAAQLGIKQRNLIIKGLKNDIIEKEHGINTLDVKVVAGEESLAQMLRQTHQIDETPIVELILGQTLSASFQEIDRYTILKQALDESFQQMTLQRADLTARKEALEDKQSEEQDLLQIQVLQQQDLKEAERQKQQLVAAARGQESVYMQIIAGKQKTATQLEEALFGLRDAGPISFGIALQYAKEAAAKTGVRAALILAVLKQETNLGENVGQCLLTNSPHMGDGMGKNTGTPIAKVMKPDRDVAPFMQLTQELGLDPMSQVVSCPQRTGYGGAMGPAQFIASTWVLYRNRLTQTTGTNPPNPWNPRTAIFATALYLEDQGADNQSRSAERKAALKFFAGGNWSKPAYAFYGDHVMDYADDIQQQINLIGG